MQAIILAAGLGTRLKPLTDTLPKGLTEVCEKPLLINTLDVLNTYDVDEVIIVLGYLGKEIEKACGNLYGKMKITYVYNEIFRETNNNYSLYMAKDYIKDDVLLLECDLFYGKELLQSLIETNADCGIVVSNYNPQTMDGTIVYANEEDSVYKMVLKKNLHLEVMGENPLKTVNIYKFKLSFWKNIFMPELENYIIHHDKKNYYELALGAVIYYGDSDIRAIRVSEDLWAEIDDVHDLELAEAKFGDK